jgi:hypothetical protein
MGDIITSSVRGDQPSQPPTQNSSSSTSLVQMRANTHVSSSVTDVVDIFYVNYDDLFCDYNTLTKIQPTTYIKIRRTSSEAARSRHDYEKENFAKYCKGINSYHTSEVSYNIVKPSTPTTHLRCHTIM